MNIYLWGMPASGKTYIGKQLAKLLGKEFLDLDQIIEESEGLSIPEIFRTKGERYFRQAETILLNLTIQQHANFVLATGGGTPVFYDNHELMNQTGITVYIKTPIDQLVERIWEKRSQRPLHQGVRSKRALKRQLEKMLSQREPYYLKAQLVWDSSQPVELLAQQLRQMYTE